MGFETDSCPTRISLQEDLDHAYKRISVLCSVLREEREASGILERNTEIARLNGRISEFCRRISELEEEYRTEVERSQKLANEMVKQQARAIHAEGLAEVRLRRIEELAKEVAEKAVIADYRVNQIDNQAKTIRSYREENAKLKEENSRLCSENNSLRESIATKINDQISIRDENARLQEFIDTQAKAVHWANQYSECSRQTIESALKYTQAAHCQLHSLSAAFEKQASSSGG